MNRIRRTREYPISTALASAMGSLPSSTKIYESLAFTHWSSVVGAQAAAATEPESVRDGTLFVITKSAVWSHEMSVMKAHLITELNDRIGKSVIKDIVFRAKGIKSKEAKTQKIGQPTEDDLKQMCLPAKEQAALQTELDNLESIPDDRIRSAISVRLTHDRKLSWWRLQNGWTACRRCGVPHDLEGRLCPICRLSRNEKR